MNRSGVVWVVGALGAVWWMVGCGVSTASRDRGELREVGLPAEEAMEAAAGVLGTQGYQLERVTPAILTAKVREDNAGARVASTATGAAVGGTAAAAGAGPVGSILLGLGSSMAINRGPREAHITVQVEPLDPAASAMRATAVVNGRITPGWKPLEQFWADLSERAPVGPPTDRARAALPAREPTKAK
jgi:hypothetical protein